MREARAPRLSIETNFLINIPKLRVEQNFKNRLYGSKIAQKSLSDDSDTFQSHVSQHSNDIG